MQSAMTQDPVLAQAADEMRALAKKLEYGAAWGTSESTSPRVAMFLAYRLKRWAKAIEAADVAGVVAAWESIGAISWPGDRVERDTYLEAARLLRVALEIL